MKRTCEIENCEKEARYKRWCINHYHRWYRYGSPYIKLKRGRAAIRIKTKCYICKKELYRLESRIKKTQHSLCSKECHGKFKSQHMQKQKNPRWNNGNSQYLNHSLMKKNRLIILLNNPKCEKCGKSATCIHHKDGSKSNHQLSNLMAICHKCNSKIRFRLNNSKYRKFFGSNLEEMALSNNYNIFSIWQKMKTFF